MQRIAVGLTLNKNRNTVKNAYFKSNDTYEQKVIWQYLHSIAAPMLSVDKNANVVHVSGIL